MRVLIVNGPNLNLLGTREPEIYGSETLDDLERTWRRHATRIGIGISTFQSNHEGAIIDTIQGAVDRFDGIVINPGAFSHYSYAIYDALVAVGIPYVEVHLSNIYDREPWRATSVTGAAAIGIVYGRGPVGYLNAIDLLTTHVGSPPTTVEYGTGPETVADLRVPATTPAPVAVLVHGGFWREVWKRDVMAPMAATLPRHGWATVNLEYTRGEGSLPAAAQDVAAGIGWVVAHGAAHGLDPARIVVVGHSAGGYLALRAAHTIDGLTAAVALAPVTDLRAMSAVRSADDSPDDPVTAVLGSSADADPASWDAAELPGEPRTTVHLVHGSDDLDVPVDQSTSYAERHPDRSHLHVLDGVAHMELIDPCDPAFDAVLGVLDEISSRRPGPRSS